MICFSRKKMGLVKFKNLGLFDVFKKQLHQVHVCAIQIELHADPISSKHHDHDHDQTRVIEVLIIKKSWA